MQIHERIIAAFPSAKPLEDFVLQDDSDGRGVFLAECNIQEPEMISADLVDLLAEMRARKKERFDEIVNHATRIEDARKKAAKDADAAEQQKKIEASVVEFDV